MSQGMQYASAGPPDRYTRFVPPSPPRIKFTVVDASQLHQRVLHPSPPRSVYRNGDLVEVEGGQLYRVRTVFWTKPNAARVELVPYR